MTNFHEELLVILKIFNVSKKNIEKVSLTRFYRSNLNLKIFFESWHVELVLPWRRGASFAVTPLLMGESDDAN